MASVAIVSSIMGSVVAMSVVMVSSVVVSSAAGEQADRATAATPAIERAISFFINSLHSMYADRHYGSGSKAFHVTGLWSQSSSPLDVLKRLRKHE